MERAQSISHGAGIAPHQVRSMPAQLQTVRFPPDTMKFLREIKAHNEKTWFEPNKPRYEAIKAVALEFVEEAGLLLQNVSPHVVADAKPVGGSLMRIYRDTRFSKDKSPYKTAIGIHFHHDAMTEEHGAPGFFLHIEPGESGVYAGMWHPDTASLGKIRDAIVADPAGWKKAKGKLKFEGESLARVPRGYDADHPMADDLRRKDFVGVVALKDADVLAADFVPKFVAACKTLAPLNEFLAEAVGAKW
jgi:uncharacterized protein (TIGR02453 family)